jgi:glycosyltransferase involved in cell wall biosynthesis
LPEVSQDAAHYFNPLDVSDMAQKVAEVLDDKVLRENLITKGASLVKTYSWERMAKQTLAVYEAALKAAHKSL